jgi:hypothetical protein
MKSKRDKGLGKYKGTYLQTGSQEEKDEIDRKKHVAAIKAAIEKGQFVKNNDLTEEERIRKIKPKKIKKKKQLRKIRSSRKNKINY